MELVKKILVKDRVVALITIAFSLFYIFYIAKIPDSQMASDPGPKIFPYIAGILMLTMSVLLFLFPKKEEKKGAWMTKLQKHRMVSLYGVYVLFVGGMYLIGYTIPTFATLFTASTMFAKGKNISWWKRFVYAAVMTVAVWALFYLALECQLPRGIYQGLNLLPVV